MPERIPPQDLVTPIGSKPLPFPTVIDPEAPPPRTSRHVPNSIATMRRRLIIALVCILYDAHAAPRLSAKARTVSIYDAERLALMVRDTRIVVIKLIALVANLFAIEAGRQFKEWPLKRLHHDLQSIALAKRGNWNLITLTFDSKSEAVAEPAFRGEQI